MNHDCDVLVVGAGVAGVPAAVAAARAGADTVLVEKRAFPGGTGVAGMHRYLCGLYPGTETPAGAPVQPIDRQARAYLNGGMVQEICERLTQLAPARTPIRLGKVEVLPYSPEQLKTVYTGLLEAEKRIRVSYEAEVRGIRVDEGRIKTVTVNDREITPAVVIDCSGEGVVLQGDPRLFEATPQEQRQLAGMVLQFRGLKGDDDMLPIRVPYAVRQGVESGRLTPSLKFTTFIPGDSRDEGWCKVNFPSGTSGAQVQEETRRLHDYLKDALPIFRSAVLTGCSDLLEREGLRLKGVYTLTAEDVVEARRFPDAVARSAWPIELWDPERGPLYRYPAGGQACDIPLRCLQAQAVGNLFCAGRCVSATHEALAAIRVMGTCMALGEAAGQAAAGNRTE